MSQGGRSQGGISAPQAAQAGQQITVGVNDGSASITVHVQGTTSAETVPVHGGSATVNIPRGLPPGSLIIIANEGVPPTTQIVEVVTGN